MSGPLSVDVWLGKAERALAAAALSADHDLLETAYNRAYYAMFYAVMAALAVRGHQPKTHAGTRTLFLSEFVRPGLFPRDLTQGYMNAMDERIIADYEGIDPSPERVAVHIGTATAFLAEIRRLLGQGGGLGGPGSPDPPP